MAATTKVWTDNSPPQCAAADLNGFETENNNLIRSAGIGLDTGNNLQTTLAVANYAANGDCYEDISTVTNAYELDTQNNGGIGYKAPTSYFMGMRVRFLAGESNTGAATVDPAELGVKNILDRNGDPLTGGEITEDRFSEMFYNQIEDAFILMDGGSDSTSVPTGGSIEFSGFTVPDGFLLENGAAVSRSTYLRLFSVLKLTLVGNVSNGSAVVSGLTDADLQLFAGFPVEGTGIPSGATILTVDSSTQITLSANATATGTPSLNFFPFGNGNGTTTFNLPRRQQRTAICAGSGGSLPTYVQGQLGGEALHTQTEAEIAAHAHAPLGGGAFFNDNPSGTLASGGGNNFSKSVTTTIVGSSTPFNIVQPFIGKRFIIKT